MNHLTSFVRSLKKAKNTGIGLDLSWWTIPDELFHIRRARQQHRTFSQVPETIDTIHISRMIRTRRLSYHKDHRAMHPIYGALKNF